MKRYGSALWLLLGFAVSIYAVEFVIMIILSYFPHESTVVHALFDSTLLIVLLSPVLYFFLFRPLLTHIRERVRVEETLRIERDRAQKYLDVARVMLLVLDTDGKVRLINRKGSEILGWSEEEITGKDWFENFIPERDRERMRKVFARVKEGAGLVEYYENPVVTKSGEERLISWHNAFLAEDRRIVGTLSSGEDVTERKLAEEALQESETRFRLVHDTAFDAIIVSDAGDRVIDCNPSAEKIFGYTRAELLGMDIVDLMPEKYRKDHVEGLKRFLETGIPKVQGRVEELEGLRKNGEAFPVELIVNNFRVGEKIYFSGTIRDITERKKAEEEKARFQAQLNQVQKMEAVGRLAGGIAHDFNNVLTAIRGNAELAMELMEKGGPASSNLEEILSSVSHASKLTRQLLIFSRGAPAEVVPLGLNSSVEDILKMLARLMPENIEITTDLAPDLWTVHADESAMDQVILNLAVNARDSMPQGGRLSIKTENMTLTEELCRDIPFCSIGPAVRLTVRDTGVGMEKEVLDRIFEPFFTTKEGRGMGLGLSVVYGIVRQHQGWITVESVPLKGTTFRIYIPAVLEAARKAPPEREETFHGNGERILLVEDDEGVREVARKSLTEGGYTVVDAGTARDAVEIFDRENGNFDLLLSDMFLPDLNGIDLSGRLLSRKPGLPVILTSSYLEEKHQLDARNRGFRFLQKPYSLSDLFRAVFAAVGDKKKNIR